MDQYLFFLISALVAFVLGIACFVFSLCKHKWIMVVMIGGIFLPALLLHLPLIAADGHGGWVTFFAAFYQTIRIFLIDGDVSLLDKIGDTACNVGFYKGFFVCLHLLAPITTATAILSRFRGIKAGIRFYVDTTCPKLCLFSELNDKSLALAQDIRENEKEKRDAGKILQKNWVGKLVYIICSRKSTIVFFDVYRREEEPHVELMDKADEIGALCFRRDILHWNYRRYKHQIEFFLLGEDESENIHQALDLTEKYGERPDTAVYVWARSSESVCILDSFHSVPKKEGDEQNEIKEKGVFRLRRIDDVEIFAWNILEDTKLFDKVNFGEINFQKPWESEQRISVLIVGMGEYGMEFLKTAVWMYQCEGVKLEITAIDIGAGAEKRLRHDCPELLLKNECKDEGEAHYSIRIVENIDIFGDDLERMLFAYPEKYSEFVERLRCVDTVFVTLGEDDRNIRAALELRRLFDRLHLPESLECAIAEKSSLKNWQKKEIPYPKIYTPVYDTLKMKNIMPENAETEGNRILRTYEDVPYRIDFRGSFKEQYSYENIIREKLENDAFAYHLMWYGDPSDAGEKASARASYEQFEYNRHSSMARAVQNAMLEQKLEGRLKCDKMEKFRRSVTEEEKAKCLAEMKNCGCEGCRTRRRIEHMRWNAYMRTQGWIKPDTDKKYAVKSARSKLHYELIPFDDLPDEEKFKDSAMRTEPVKK